MGSYRIRVRVMADGALRDKALDRAPAGALVGLLRGLADALECGLGEVAVLSVERSPEPPVGLAGMTVPAVMDQ